MKLHGRGIIETGIVFRAKVVITFKEGRGTIDKIFDIYLVGHDADDAIIRAQDPEVIPAALWPYRNQVDRDKFLSVRSVVIQSSAGRTAYRLDPLVENSSEIFIHR